MAPMISGTVRRYLRPRSGRMAAGCASVNGMRAPLARLLRDRRRVPHLFGQHAPHGGHAGHRQQEPVWVASTAELVMTPLTGEQWPGAPPAGAAADAEPQARVTERAADHFLGAAAPGRRQSGSSRRRGPRLTPPPPPPRRTALPPPSTT